MALDLLAAISQLVHHDRQYHLLDLWLGSNQLNENVQGQLSEVLHIILGHAYKNLCNIFSVDLLDAVIIVGVYNTHALIVLHCDLEGSQFYVILKYMLRKKFFELDDGSFSLLTIVFSSTSH